MGKVVVSQFMTLDGVVEDTGGSEGLDRGGWAFKYERGEEGDKFKLDNMPKYVVSSTVKDLEWNNSTVIDGDVAVAVSQLREDVDGDILVNGTVQLVNELMAKGLVDELRLMLYPTVLGAGKRLFTESGEPASLRLTESKPAGETLTLIYEPARDT